MGYVAVKGGSKAIEESIKALKYERLKGRKVINANEIEASMRGLIDIVMSEGSIYSRELAALAIKQSEGNVEEAVFLIRAYRSTLERKHYTTITETKNMKIERRISSSFKDILGGQILGAAYDYTHRLLDFTLRNEDIDEIKGWLERYEYEALDEERTANLREITKVVDYLRRENLIKDYEEDNSEPADITREMMEFPTSRGEKLQALTRGQTGGVNSLAYSALRGYGIAHPTVGELRVGYLPIAITSPIQCESDDEDGYYIGDILVTEVETFVPVNTKTKDGRDKISFQLGYGLCYGQNETKAISMSILDYCLEEKNKDFPTGDEEFVLMSIDAVESTGFLSHLKLPHYVTFQSELDSVRKTQGEVK